MTELFKAKIRKIGTSAGILIPYEKLRQIEAEVGDNIELAILHHRKDFSGFGIAKHSKAPFLRDKKVRNFT